MDTFLNFLFSIIVSFIWYNIGYQKGYQKGYQNTKELYEKNPIIKYVDKPIYINPNALRTVTLTSGYTENKVEKPSGPITYTQGG